MKAANNSRILMDVSMTAKWRRNGVMVGIVRVACEMFRGLGKLAQVHMVELKRRENGEEPEIRVIHPETFEVTEEVIFPKEGDLYLMPEIQIRGIHVPMDYPWPGFLAKYGINRCAIIYDILPIEMGEYFERETAQRMPEYLAGIFRNFNQMICISEAVRQSVQNFWEKGEIGPYSLYSKGLTEAYFHAVFQSGWTREKGFLHGSAVAEISFYTVMVSPLVIQCEIANADSEYRVIANGYDVGVIQPGGMRTQTFVIPAEILNQDGYQEIRLDSSHSQGGIVLSEINLWSSALHGELARQHTAENIQIAAALLGVQSRREAEAASADKTELPFFRRCDGEKIFLMVGTIEPRKGHALALDTFDRLWQDGREEKLCIVGRPGWNTGDLIERIRNHPQNGKKLLLIEDASDEVLQGAYQGADALIQASAGEGFGLPLIEAGEHGKPILCSDIPVFHEVGGDHVLYFQRDPDDLARCIQFFLKHEGTDRIPDARCISKRSWDDFSQDCYWLMTGQKQWPVCFEAEREKKRKLRKVVVATTFPVFPPLNGGQSRIYGLYKNLAKEYWVELICMVPHIMQKKRRMIAPNLVENVIPMSEENEIKGTRFERQAGVPASDMSVLLYCEKTSDYARAIQEIGKDAEWIVSCHPYSYPVMRSVLPEKKMIYEAQDVEYEIKKGMYCDNPDTEEALRILFNAEKDCCQDSEFIMTCSEMDQKRLMDLYGLQADRIIVVPNGVDTEEIQFVDLETRLRNKREQGLTSEKIGIFMGAYHEPNLEAAKVLIHMADQLTGVKIFLMGSQCDYFERQDLPANIALLGVVSEEEKRRIFSMVDFALNPMISGSGTNVKMFDYMAAGVPVITTAYGSRSLEDKKAFILCENERLAEIIQEFQLPRMKEMIAKARVYTKETFDWEVISRILIGRMQKK